MPFLVRFLVTHAVIGVSLAVVLVGAMVAFDVAGIGTLTTTSEDGLLALVLLTFGLGVTFGSVQMGFAVMLMSEGEEPPRGRRVLTRLVPRYAKVSASR
ncbi:hypothetical protein [Xanthobacter agilis]|jgi:hypothetical protein|uniref:Uncharacterized protein n=1 Tax=Xanthobacter agilis TaxID=47492 RepID=A0ABU0L9C1_XANAG|nr:hypothetical protein [Xanthobacter agilis]MDQ0503718.1 hypothetical protein [Xanthobacter agilis]